MSTTFVTYSKESRISQASQYVRNWSNEHILSCIVTTSLGENGVDFFAILFYTHAYLSVMVGLFALPLCLIGRLCFVIVALPGHLY